MYLATGKARRDCSLHNVLPRGCDEKSLLLGFLCSPPALRFSHSSVYGVAETPPALWCRSTFPWRTCRQLKRPCRQNNRFNFLLCASSEVFTSWHLPDVQPRRKRLNAAHQHGVHLRDKTSKDFRRWDDDWILNNRRRGEVRNTDNFNPVLQSYFITIQSRPLQLQCETDSKPQPEMHFPSEKSTKCCDTSQASLQMLNVHITCLYSL